MLKSYEKEKQKEECRQRVVLGELNDNHNNGKNMFSDPMPSPSSSSKYTNMQNQKSLRWRSPLVSPAANQKARNAENSTQYHYGYKTQPKQFNAKPAENTPWKRIQKTPMKQQPTKRPKLNVSQFPLSDKEFEQSEEKPIYAESKDQSFVHHTPKSAIDYYSQLLSLQNVKEETSEKFDASLPDLNISGESSSYAQREPVILSQNKPLSGENPYESRQYPRNDPPVFHKAFEKSNADKIGMHYSNYVDPVPIERHPTYGEYIPMRYVYPKEAVRRNLPPLAPPGYEDYGNFRYPIDYREMRPFLPVTPRHVSMPEVEYRHRVPVRNPPMWNPYLYNPQDDLNASFLARNPAYRQQNYPAYPPDVFDPEKYRGEQTRFYQDVGINQFPVDKEYVMRKYLHSISYE
ncbi:unnamed protein product [Phyllotreta striolata]|uniref:Uncharacterized protein n=1 Tax=Phyllotreta striolata TaxID=444603 RepID=A0A9P0GVZ4_PHYSR|nr:unnamed protein product [Phyllotreta striolata]